MYYWNDTVDDNKLQSLVRNNVGYSVVEVDGEIDINTVSDLRDTLFGIVESGSNKIIVNMSRVRYVDSSGFGALMATAKTVRPLGGCVCLVACNDAVQRMLRMTQLQAVFELHPDENAAVAAINGPATA